jgi:hypothetical protein
MNGAGPYEGRVEICWSGVWKSVCTHSWNNPDARVVCAQLNYLPQGITIIILWLLAYNIIVLRITCQSMINRTQMHWQ